MKNALASVKQQINRMSLPTRILAVLLSVSSIVMSIGLTSNTRPLQIVGAIIGTAYIFTLIWWLARSKPHSQDLPDIIPVVKIFPTYRPMLLFTIFSSLLLVSLTCFLFKDGWLMLLLSILFSLVIIIFRHKHVNRRLIIACLILATVLAFVEQLLGPDMSSGLVMPIGVAIMFLAGALLLEHTKLTHIRLLNRDYLAALKSFLKGCALAVPPALLNVITMQFAASSEFDLLFDRWWEPLYALQPGILEEVWARLLLTTLVYALLRPTSNKSPQRALIWALLIAAFIHGMAHYPSSTTNPMEGFYLALMYGVPLSLLYVKRDFERAVAYHFFIDFVRFGASVIWNSSM